MSVLTVMDKIFLEDPKRMEMGKGKLSKRYNVSEEEVEASRAKVKRILSATELVQTLDDHDYKGSIKDTAKTIVANSAESSLDFQIDIVKRQCDSKIKAEQDKYKTILTAYEDLESRYNDALVLGEQRPVTNIPLIPEIGRQGASIVHWGDWHVEKVIEKAAVNGFNEFNPDIARKRAYKCADSSVKLINRDSSEFNQHNTLLYLTGDFIEGYIHPESQMIVNSMTPIEASAFALELLTDCIKRIQETAETDKITVICRNGNHSRTTKRMESSVDHRSNYETMIYAFLAQKFKGEIDFHLPESDIGYFSILGKLLGISTDGR